MHDYSQYEEQKYILEFFEGYTGTCLDVGAANGITFSNVYKLLLDGWSCVSVEPETQTFRELLRNYEQFGNRVTFLSAVIDTEPKFVTFYENGQLSSTSHEHMDKWKEHTLKHNTIWKPVTHYAITMDMLLENYSDRNFDFISVDIEGQNIDVVCNTNWDLASNCKLLCVEHDQQPNVIIDSLKKYDFKPYNLTPVNILLSR